MSLIIFQMIRVISSPSISTMGFFTVIATIVFSCEKAAQNEKEVGPKALSLCARCEFAVQALV
jgi:hypothetical protein